MFRRSRAKLLRRLILHVGKHRDAGRQPGENRKSVLVPCWSPVWRPANAWDLDGKQCPPIIGADAVTEMRQVKHAYETRSYGAAENRVLSTWYLVARKERWFG